MLEMYVVPVPVFCKKILPAGPAAGKSDPVTTTFGTAGCITDMSSGSTDIV
jgi:hypothetical protein